MALMQVGPGVWQLPLPIPWENGSVNCFLLPQAEVVEHNQTGFVVRYAWQYADAVIELLQNETLRKRFGQQGYEKARDQFEASKLTRKLEALYTDVMGHSG